MSRWLKAARRVPGRTRSRLAHRGRLAKLTPEQLRLIPDFLWPGAEAYGFRGEVWTCRRIGCVLAEELGLAYSRSHVSRRVKRIGWTPQVPVERAIQRDEAAIRRWRLEVWPAIQRQAQKQRRRLVFIDESGFYLLPAVVRTYAPKGRRPVQKKWQSQDHLSVMGALTPQGHLYSLVRQDPLTGLETLTFLSHLLTLTEGPLLVVWDNSPIHRRAEVKQFLAAGAGRRIHLEPLPPYAPDLNPVEWLWGYCKNVELRTLACLDLEQLHLELHFAWGRRRQKPRLIHSFFAGAELIW